ncbi:hypothetical protein QI600_004746 [Salmonella enterica]|nr:hypothetical protein [Salmonella enterica]
MSDSHLSKANFASILVLEHTVSVLASYLYDDQIEALCRTLHQISTSYSENLTVVEDLSENEAKDLLNLISDSFSRMTELIISKQNI